MKRRLELLDPASSAVALGATLLRLPRLPPVASASRMTRASTSVFGWCAPEFSGAARRHRICSIIRPRQSRGLYPSLPVAHKFFCVVPSPASNNLVTHPIVFFGFMSSRLPYVWAVPLAEVFAVVSEMFLYYFFLRGLTFRRAFVASLVANLFSWQVAPVMTWGILQIITQT